MVCLGVCGIQLDRPLQGQCGVVLSVQAIENNTHIAVGVGILGCEPYGLLRDSKGPRRIDSTASAPGRGHDSSGDAGFERQCAVVAGDCFGVASEAAQCIAEIALQGEISG